MSNDPVEGGENEQARWQQLSDLKIANQPGCEQQALDHLYKVLSLLQLPYPLLQKAARNVYNTIKQAYDAQRSPELLLRCWVATPAEARVERSWGFFLIERPLEANPALAAPLYCIELYCYQEEA